MAQCQKTLDNGERCSNRAVPGAKFCERHRRIQFRPVEAPPTVDLPQAAAPPVTEQGPGGASAPASAAGPEPSDARGGSELTATVPLLVAVPSAGGDAPAFPGLRADARGVLVAPEAVIWLPATAGALMPRLVRLLCLLTTHLDLAVGVEVCERSGAGGALVHLLPPEAGAEKASIQLDALAAAAGESAVRGLMLVGEGRCFVRYRTPTAPRGFDAAGVSPAQTGDWLLVTERGPLRIAEPELTALAPGQVLLDGVATLPRPGSDGADQVWVLAAAALFPVLARYLRNHGLHYALARLLPAPGECPGAGARVLLALETLPGAPSGAHIPRFVLDYLTRLPRVLVLVLVAAFAQREQRMLVQWRRRLPFEPARVSGLFEPNALLLFTGGEAGNLYCTPTPDFIDGDRLTAPLGELPAATTLKPVAADTTPVLPLPLRLLPDPGPTPPTAALVLSPTELGWIKRLLYRLPTETFDDLLLYPGREAAVLLGRSGRIEGIPFGEPLRRLGDTDLFLPLRQRLVPRLPWSLLRETLALTDGTLTLITATRRLDLPRDDLAPISRALLAEPPRPRVAVALRDAAKLPALHWQPLPEPPTADQDAEPAARRRGLLERLLPQSQANAEPAEAASGEPTDSDWRARAAAFEQQGDLLAAALCYSLSDDPHGSARCLRGAGADTPSAR